MDEQSERFFYLPGKMSSDFRKKIRMCSEVTQKCIGGKLRGEPATFACQQTCTQSAQDAITWTKRGPPRTAKRKVFYRPASLFTCGSILALLADYSDLPTVSSQAP